MWFRYINTFRFHAKDFMDRRRAWYDLWGCFRGLLGRVWYDSGGVSGRGRALENVLGSILGSVLGRALGNGLGKV